MRRSGSSAGSRGALDKVHAAVRPSEKCTNVWTLVVSVLVQDNMNGTFEAIARLNPGKKLRGTDRHKGRVRGFQVELTTDIGAPAPCSGCHGGF